MSTLFFSLLVVGSTATLMWWTRREHRRHAAHLLPVLHAIRDLLRSFNAKP